MMSPDRSAWPSFAAISAVLLLFCVPLFVGLGRTDLQNDEAIYSYAVDRILETGQWLTPRSIHNDGPFFEKPPLKFWLTAASIRFGMLPHDEMGLRFIDAVFGSIAFLYVYALGRWLGGGVCGFISVLVLFTVDRLLFDHGLRSNNMDAALVLSYSAGIYHFARWAEARTRWGGLAHALAVGVYFVLGFMTKFVAALFLPPICALALLLRSDAWRRVRSGWVDWIVSGAVVAAGTLPWFLYENGRSSILWKIMLDQHVYTRFTGALDPAHLQPWHFYFTQMWTELSRAGSVWIVVAGALTLAVEACRGGSWLARLMLVWAFFPIALISLGTSKLFHYTYPFLPPLALGAGFASVKFIRAVNGWRGDGVPSWLRSPAPLRNMRSPRVRVAIQQTMLVGGSLACVIAGWTAGTGRLWQLEEVNGLTSASLATPVLAAAFMFWVGDYLPVVFRPIAVLALAMTLPILAYPGEIGRLNTVRHPLKAARDCAVAVRGTGIELGTGVYNAGNLVVYHSYYYYLRHLGRWRSAEHPDTNELRQRLFEPGRQTLVLMSRSDYEALAHRHTVAPGLSESVADQSSGPPVLEPPEGTPASIGVAAEEDIAILLPAPFKVCAARIVAAGGMRLPEGS
jgi:4-amino-4-deoxy-L-arabinose transferase-like glycosyltransferase